MKEFPTTRKTTPLIAQIRLLRTSSIQLMSMSLEASKRGSTRSTVVGTGVALPIGLANWDLSAHCKTILLHSNLETWRFICSKARFVFGRIFPNERVFMRSTRDLNVEFKNIDELQ